MTDTDVHDLRPEPPRVLSPGDPGWDATRATFNLLTDQRPDAIALPSDEPGVAAAIAIARERGLRVTAQATGHGAGSLRSLDGTMLVNTSHLTEVAIDAEARRVRVGAGVRWRDVTAPLSAVGLAALHGSSPDVGIVGYSLGGGMGWLAREHGLQCNAVRAIELVTADGRMLRVDAEHDAELFWALRGGGGSFGIVTALEFEVVPVRELTAGSLFFPVDRTADVLRAWTDLLPSLPDALTSWVTILHFPPFDDVPADFRGRSFAIVMAAHLGPERDARVLLQPVLDLGPLMDTLGPQAPIALGTLAMDPEAPLPFRTTSALIEGLDHDTIADVARLSGAGSPLTLVQFRHLGGALSRPPSHMGARATLAGELAAFSIALVPTLEAEPDVVAQIDELAAAIAPHKVGDYANLVEEPADASTFFDAGTWDRLCAVKSSVDPDDVVLGTHHVPAVVPA